MLRRWLVRSLALPLLSLGACPEPRPGIELGTYLVVATRSVGNCGALREEGSYSFQTSLTLRAGLLRWSEGSRGPVDGTYDATARAFRVVSEASALLAPANRAAEFAGCTIVRQDVIDGRFQGEVPNPALADGGPFEGPPFVGAYSVLWAPAPGSDCRPFIGASAQQWAALPCSTTYRLDGTRR